MREHYTIDQQRHHRAVRVLLSFLFLLFVFCFFLFFQNDLIAVMQETWSRGITRNNPVITACIVGGLLLLLQTGLHRLFNICGRWEAFSFLPSFMILSLSTDVSSSSFHYESSVKWIVILVVAFAVTWVVPHLCDMVSRERKTSFVSLLATNLAVFALSMASCMALTNHDAPLHMELAAFRYADLEDVERVSHLGERSLETTPALTALRNAALCREGRAGEALFSLPQPYGVDGMLPGRYIRHDTRYGAEVWNRLVDSEPYGGEKALDFCHRLYRTNDTPFHRDLYIAALLLDRQLDVFSREFPPALMGDTLAPRHYREAWLLAQYEGVARMDYQDSELEPLFDAFLALDRLPDATPLVTANRRQLSYGKTYWNYYYKP